MKKIASLCAVSATLIVALSSVIAGTEISSSKDKNVAAASAPECNWAGFYIGGNVGGSWTHYDFKSFDGTVFFDIEGLGTDTESPHFPGSVGTDEVEVAVGGQIGYLWQFNRWVIGLELDGQSLGNSDRPAIEKEALDGFAFVRLDSHAYTDWMASGRVRAGYAFGCILPYITGGVAVAQTTVDTRVLTASEFSEGGFALGRASDDNTSVGYSVGAGIDWQVVRWARIGIEYRFSDFGSDSYHVASTSDVTAGAFRNQSRDLELYNHQVTLRVNIPFSTFFGGR